MAWPDNTLEPGETRIGFIFDNDPKTSDMATSLTNEGGRITLTVPWISGRVGEGYRRWFLSGFASFGDDVDRTKYAYSVPQVLHFRDSRGSLCLVGARDITWRESGFGRSVGQGVLEIKYLVEGVSRSPYMKINGLRSELDGLSSWVRVESVSRTTRRDDMGKLSDVNFVLTTLPALDLHRKLNLKLVPEYGVQRVRVDETLISDRLVIESDVRSPRDWSEHLDAHHALRDLLRVSSWQSLDYVDHWARRDDDPDLTVDGREYDRSWRHVVTHETGISPRLEKPPRYLFLYDHIGARGVRRWIKLRDDYSTGIDAMMSLFQYKASLNTSIAEVGMALEAIGFRLALEDGFSKRKAGEQTHKDRLNRIADSAGEHMVIPNREEWIARAVRAYNGVKHANRNLPEERELYLSWLEMSALFRAWVAGRIGVSAEQYSSAAKLDRQYQRILHIQNDIYANP